MKNQKLIKNRMKSAKKTQGARVGTNGQDAPKAVAGSAGATRPPLERMQAIHGWLKAKEYPNCARMSAMFEVNRKTALRDIAFMQRRMNMPIAYDDKRHGYYFDGPAPEFGTVALSERELVGLCFFGKAMEQYRGTTAEKPLEAFLSRVSRQL